MRWASTKIVFPSHGRPIGKSQYENINANTAIAKNRTLSVSTANTSIEAANTPTTRLLRRRANGESRFSESALLRTRRSPIQTKQAPSVTITRASKAAPNGWGYGVDGRCKRRSAPNTKNARPPATTTPANTMRATGRILTFCSSKLRKEGSSNDMVRTSDV